MQTNHTTQELGQKEDSIASSRAPLDLDLSDGPLSTEPLMQLNKERASILPVDALPSTLNAELAEITFQLRTFKLIISVQSLILTLVLLLGMM